jgi:hypothetical protein
MEADMANLKYSVLISLLLLSTEGIALNLAETEQPLTQGLYDNRSCNDLYMQASALEQKTFLYKTNFYSDTRVASYALAVLSPAIYLFGYTPYQNHLDQSRSQVASNDIKHIRLRMAEKRCFERN